MPTTEDILRKYGAKIESQIGESQTQFTHEYQQFKQDMLPANSRYQRWCQALGSIIKLKLGQKEEQKVQKQLSMAHLDVTPSQTITLAVIAFLLTFLVTTLTVLSIFLITEKFQFLFFFLGLVTSIFVFYYVYTLPQRLANIWRLKASSQMVPAILYVVVYMKHTSNLEKAVEFAARNLEAPLALDFRKLFWDVEIGKFSTIKQSLDHYLENWRDYAPEFAEAFHLIESSLFEPDESRRVQTLEKSLQVILDGVYEKMLKYTREIRAPLTNLYMLGIILPTLGLALLPLASVLIGGALKWNHIFVIFNVIIPFFVFYMTSEVLFKRPGGHGETSVLELNPDYYKFASKKPWIIAFILCFPLFLIGTLPFLFQVEFITKPLGLQNDYFVSEIAFGLFPESDIKIFDFKQAEDGSTVGPYGPGAILLSLFIPLSLALFFSLAYKMKTKDLIKARNETRLLEEEFTNSLFQLGNRLGDGTPAEIAFAKVASTTQGQRTQSFFALVNQNIQQAGMSVEDAIFNKKRGAIIFYPSAIIATSMQILSESVKKGLSIAARSLMSISEYVKNMHKIDERLHDLLAEVVSDMKSNMTFLAPLLAGIVVGLGAMIAAILNKLQAFTQLESESELAGLGSLSDIVTIFEINKMIPPYFLQVAIGIYILQVAFILTAALVTVDSGRDPLRERHELAKNLKRSMYLYIATAALAIGTLSILAAVALGSMAS